MHWQLTLAPNCSHGGAQHLGACGYKQCSYMNSGFHMVQSTLVGLPRWQDVALTQHRQPSQEAVEYGNWIGRGRPVSGGMLCCLCVSGSCQTKPSSFCLNVRVGNEASLSCRPQSTESFIHANRLERGLYQERIWILWAVCWDFCCPDCTYL